MPYLSLIEICGSIIPLLYIWCIVPKNEQVDKIETKNKKKAEELENNDPFFDDTKSENEHSMEILYSNETKKKLTKSQLQSLINKHV